MLQTDFLYVTVVSGVRVWKKKKKVIGNLLVTRRQGEIDLRTAVRVFLPLHILCIHGKPKSWGKLCVLIEARNRSLRLIGSLIWWSHLFHDGVAFQWNVMCC